jgi:PAS domain S-box-containing protein
MSDRTRTEPPTSRALRVLRRETGIESLIEQLPLGVYVTQDSIVRYANPALAQMLGCASPDELVGTSMFDLLHADDVARLRDYVRRTDAGEATGSSRGRWKRRDGAWIIVEGTRTAITFEGTPAAIVYVRDVTREERAHAEHARMEEALRQSEARYRFLFKESPIPSLMIDAETLRILAANEAAARFYGYAREELVGLSLREIKVGDDVEREIEHLRSHSAGGWQGVKTHRRKDGTHVRVGVNAQATVFEGRRVNIATCLDLTEKTRLEEQLRHAQKMEAVGRLAGGVAHDFNNLLAVILTGTELALSAPDLASALEEIRDIDAAARRGAALTRQLLTFSRRQPYEARPLSLSALVGDMQRMLARVAAEDVTLTIALAPKVGTIDADPAHVEQVLMNLAVNGRDAMPKGGAMRVETADVTLGADRAAAMGVAPGAYVMLSVEDTGVGMDAATRARLFEPFFTTKEVGKGTGLGLATVFGILQVARAGIEVESEPGRGSTFRVFFPCAPEAPRFDSETPTAIRARRAPREAAVLVVEDDEQLRDAIRRTLTAYGLGVIETRDPEQALELARAHRATLRLVLTDVVLPQMDGRAMAERIRAELPDVEVLFMSGYADHPLLREGRFGAGERFVPKPFSARELLAAIERVIGPASSP